MVMPQKNIIAEAPETSLLLGDIPDSKPNSPEIEAAEVRRRAIHDISAFPWLPQLPDDWVNDIYEQLEEAERIASPSLIQEEYRTGSARYADQVVVINGSGSMLFAAPHATQTMRKDPKNPENRILGFPDTGTAALAKVIAPSHGHSFVMNGLQTSNAAVDPEHPIRHAIKPYITDASGFLDIHGCSPHLYVRPRDRYNMHASIGLGTDPSERDWQLAENIRNYARETLGLYAIIGNHQEYYSQNNETLQPKRNKEGSVYRNRLAALKPTMLTNFVRNSTSGTIPSLQIELSGTCRLTPLDDDRYPKDERTRRFGAALGFKLIEYAADAMSSVGQLYPDINKITT